MEQQQIIRQLKENHSSFIAYIHSLSNEEFLFSLNGKWSAGQQLDHICRSVKPLTQIATVPKFIIRLLFGKANRQSKTYEELIKKYLLKLETGGRASGRFIPKVIHPDEKEKLTTSLSKLVERLTSAISNFSEEELDTLILPHPLLGKLTIREMLYFTIYHAEHHLAIIKRDLATGK